MAHKRRIALMSGLLLAASAGWSEAADPTLVSIKTSRGAKQSFILIKPDKPVASVILFAGAHGGLGLQSASTMRWGAGNFLVRTRDKFAAHDLMVAVVDAPSDRPQGMNFPFRMGSAHAGDIGAVASYLKKQADVPVWLVGTSSGTYSAGALAITLKEIDGLVLTSTITRSKPQWEVARSHPDGVASMPLQRVTVPTLILSHRKDACAVTPPADAAKLSKRLTKARKVDVVLVEGGDQPEPEPCEGKSYHGFAGIESEVVDKIAAFVKANGK